MYFIGISKSCKEPELGVSPICKCKYSAYFNVFLSRIQEKVLQMVKRSI